MAEQTLKVRFTEQTRDLIEKFKEQLRSLDMLIEKASRPEGMCIEDSPEYDKAVQETVDIVVQQAEDIKDLQDRVTALLKSRREFAQHISSLQDKVKELESRPTGGETHLHYHYPATNPPLLPYVLWCGDPTLTGVPGGTTTIHFDTNTNKS